jgi:hypothetical protein
MNCRTLIAGVLLAATCSVVGCEPSRQAPATAEGTRFETRVAATPTGTPAPEPTVPVTPAASSPIATATTAAPPTRSDARNLPRDEHGRVMGGPYEPIVNYSPDMITGRPCPRVTRWTFRLVPLSPPLQPYGIADDPCVIQNAVDDYARTAFAQPAFNTPESMREVAPLYASDPALLDGLDETIHTSLLKYYLDGTATYNSCDKPVYRLLDVDAHTPLVADSGGAVSGKVLRLTVLRSAIGVQPFTCRLLSYKDSAAVGSYRFTVTGSESGGGQDASQVGLRWDAGKKSWAVYEFRTVPLPHFVAVARALWKTVK